MSGLFRLFTVALTAVTLTTTGAVAQATKSKVTHCNSAMSKSCEALEQLTGFDDAWAVAAYGAAMCGKSLAIEKARKTRKNRYQMDEYLAKIAKDEDREHKAWKPNESDSNFARRTRSECADSRTYYCAEMAKQAASLSGDSKEIADAAIKDACG